jgi:hypothetical protein
MISTCFVLTNKKNILIFLYKPEDRGFETGWHELIFSIYVTLPAALGPGIYSASDRNKYQKQKNNVSGE